MKDFFGLKNKDIWVFGGAGYLGQSIVSFLHDMEAKVLCIDLEDRALNFVQQASLEGKVSTASLDVRNISACKDFIDKQLEQRGTPFGLVNLTFTSTSKKLEELTEKDVDDSNHGGLTATLLIARQVGSAMAIEKRGSIVLFSSMYGIVSPKPDIYEAPMVKNPIEYGIGKAGVIQMTRYLAVHWGNMNVRCNCISPGPFPNPTVQKNNPLFTAKLAQQSPLGRIGQAHEMSGSVAYLLSDLSSYVSGHNLIVDGGWTSC
ncbi:NAD(P)-dependent dehydrogenase (short-subunit alcohol dehydrogenase family) [Catalinimonas alkaloidigena]|uniref:SDR family oxidoreductase n=1 Tax=Catalinimonas alkaloidigena TaxID=1075417 RepID=UPI002404EA3F|nr:SDR family oxidoreductase [Catalinimonas alkaloidigena]MDF9798927.1 NAD(P)-dependent dehydrogenase (short-subunit alcohol dehydrogenase family) [Catalinimonas alkaloidigena]